MEEDPEWGAEGGEGGDGDEKDPWNEDFVPGNDGPDLNANIPSSSIPQYNVISIENVESKMKESVDEIKELFSISEDDSITLLKRYKWNKDKLQSAYFDNPNKVFFECGTQLDPERGVEMPSTPYCLICFESMEGKSIDSLACKHVFCSNCWSMYCQAAVNSGKDCVLTSCPLVGCPVIVPKSIFTKYLPSALLKEYSKFICKSFTDENKVMKWCPAPGCKYVIQNDLMSKIEVTCKCGKIFCFGCGEESHIPCTCENIKTWNIKNSAESENLVWIMANTKMCPKCQKPTEKNLGCNHMTCTQCRHEYCWVCMGPWSQHGASTGGYYKCNKYEEAIKTDKSLVESERKQEEAKTELKKYQFFFERYNNHRRSMDLAKKEYEKSDEKISSLHKAKNYPFTELTFLKNAAESMIEVRRVLANSYIYGYYLKNEKEKPLFENLQGLLEDNCDHLTQLLEKNLSEFTDPNKVDISPFYKYKLELTNYFEITKKFYKNFCDGVKTGLTSGNIQQHSLTMTIGSIEQYY